jgi:adenosyl cobinamide kinase/adenosyl cobinamide phosphate guanylyltransferase
VTLVLYLGGARSGKSRLAVERATSAGAPVTFVATGEAGDDEMAARIEVHKRERPPGWRTIEEPLDLAGALASVPGGETALVDCLSLWVANALERLGPEEVEKEAGLAAAAAAARPGLTVAVTNEVGMGVVPASPLGRVYRDVLGRVNALWSEAAESAYLVVAGRAIPLERLGD